MDSEIIENLARILDDARHHAQELKPLTLSLPQLTLADSYQVQEAGIDLRRHLGEAALGFKMGFTSKAKMEQMGLYTPIHGVLTDAMQISDGGNFSLAGSIHPKIEAEIVFLIGKDLEGPISREQALQSISGVASGLEILDSRYTGFKYFSLPDVVADNCSSCGFVVGKMKTEFRRLDLADLKMTLKINGKSVHESHSSAILGDPLESLIQLCSMLAERDMSVTAGNIVFAGAATPAFPLENGMQVSAEIAGMDSVSVSVIE